MFNFDVFEYAFVLYFGDRGFKLFWLSLTFSIASANSGSSAAALPAYQTIRNEKTDIFYKFFLSLSLV
jgi:hypothetical protein